MRQMFLAQTTLETWIDSGKVEFHGDVVVLTKSRLSYDLEPAVRFVSVVEGPRDLELVGKILGEAQILEFGGEMLGDSVVFGDVAFEVRPGYIATAREGASSTEAV